ncbi:GNAT family N-acetyltransferase [Aeromicrobium wangtongii]|uniref:GNAT family N-acetyltransferase n=1 Tax=Aeromicrobium wangtongii TaxID=2969247 RepID=A0ABY5MAD4_9ACTN|nr:GNAT family N-acetyltransferase [Aeromicrobium wangtongii]MCD9199727.1 GNAT family N-acetyltransferase [Aeromicrobium wangtongii]UUP14076.1 GNAT family N-acetyltransferase [Aeromicrobium wangtongii]
MTVTRAELSDIDQAAGLFADYREFYGAPHDVPAAATFLAARLDRDESIVLLARDGERAIGFAQVYPSFSSTRLAPIWVLNDLFVAEHARGSGAADELLDSVLRLAGEAGAISVELSTAHSNTRAQAVYERHGYQLDRTYRSYSKPTEPVLPVRDGHARGLDT